MAPRMCPAIVLTLIAINLLLPAAAGLEVLFFEPRQGQTIEAESNIVKVKGMVSATTEEWKVATDGEFQNGTFEDVELADGDGIVLMRGVAHFSVNEFSGTQGLFGWNYLEYDPANGNISTLDYDGDRWVGTGSLRVAYAEMLPSTKHPVKAWKAPYDNTVAVRVLAQDRTKGSTGSPDGAELIISVGDKKVGSVVIPEGDNTAREWAGDVTVQKDEQIRFRLDPKATSASDETFVNISITTTPPTGTYTSKVYTTSTGSSYNQVEAVKVTPGGSTLSFETRSYLSGTWSAWEPVNGKSPSSPAGESFQFRCRFSRMDDNLPVLKSVTSKLSTLKQVTVQANSGSIIKAEGVPNWEALVAVQEGPNTIVVKAEDHVDGSVSQSITITYKRIVVDRVPPVLTIGSPKEGDSIRTDRLKVEGTVSDDVAVEGVYVSLDNDEYHRCKGISEWSIELPVPGSDQYTVFVRAVDLSNNTNLETVTVDIEVPEKESAVPGPDAAAVIITVIVSVVIISRRRCRP